MNEQGSLRYDELLTVLRSKVSRCAGQFVLLVERNESFHGCVGFGYQPRADEYTLDTTFYMGILKSDKVQENEKGFLSFETEGCISYNPDRSNVKPFRLARTMPVGFSHFLVQEGQPLRCKNPWNVKRGATLQFEILVGDEEVENWFYKIGQTSLSPESTGKRYEEMFRTMCEALGRPNRLMQRDAGKQPERERAEVWLKLWDVLSDVETALKEAERLGMPDDKLLKFWKDVLANAPRG